jgi:hypothetical protein
MQSSILRPITSSDIDSDQAEKENTILCSGCESYKPSHAFAKPKSRSNNSGNVGSNESGYYRTCNKCRDNPLRKKRQAEKNAARRETNEAAKRQLLKTITWEDTLHKIDAGFAPNSCLF